MDIIYFQYINGFARTSSVLDWLGVFFAKYLSYLMVLTVVGYGLWQIKNRFTALKTLVVLIAALISRLIIVEIIRLFYQSPRPYMVLPSVNVFTELINRSEDMFSFPSGHAAFFFALAVAIYQYDKKWGQIYLAGAILMGLARIFVGLHWPSDILAGAVIGWLTGWFTVILITDFRKLG